MSMYGIDGAKTREQAEVAYARNYWFPEAQHVHDYEMDFHKNPDHPLDYTMRCACGDTCNTMEEAIKRTVHSQHVNARSRVLSRAGVVFVGLGLLFFVFAVVNWIMR